MQMDRTKGPPLASPTHEAARPASAPKLRRKLQKVKRPGSGAPNEVANNGTNNNKPETAPKISLPLPPDLSDSKWSEYLRSSGYLCANLDTLPQPDNSVSHSGAIVSELSYLRPGHDTPRWSVDTLGSESTDASTISARRRAKTPVFHVGQLEARARARKLEEADRRAARTGEATGEACGQQASDAAPTVTGTSPIVRGPADANTAHAEKATTKEATAVRKVTVREPTVKEVLVSSPRLAGSEGTVQMMRTREAGNGGLDLIAEQYKALIGPDDSRFMESRPETPAYPRQEGIRGLAIRHKRRSGDLRRDSQVFEHGAGKSPHGSPTSDGTLVAFEEETIYFKPLSFSPEPSSPPNNYETPSTSSLPTPNNVGLKICVDLLAQDLASAVEGNDRQPPPGASALQVWTMIEAYEKLRERIREPGLRYDELMSLEQSFDTWLKALYAAHVRLTGAYQEVSESEYDDLESAAEGLVVD